jgi:tetratricopeptide (TPR) repeat protein
MTHSELPHQRPKIQNIAELEDYIVRQMKNPDSNISIFTGAGISNPSPSNIPLAKEIIRVIIEDFCTNCKLPHYRLTLYPDITRANIKMEVIFELIQNTSGAKLKNMFRIFECSSPNTYHFFFAKLLKARRVRAIITTNFDHLIEIAFSKMTTNTGEYKLRICATEPDFVNHGEISLYKIHGTIDQPETIISVLSEVTRGLPSNKTQLLRETMRNPCLVTGWSDADMDLTPLFFQAEKDSLIWFKYAPGLGKVIDFRQPEHEWITDPSNAEIQKILERNHGILVLCDPMEFFRNIWKQFEIEYGILPIPGESTHSDFVCVIKDWSQSLEIPEQLVILGDLMKHLGRYSEAMSIYKLAENHVQLSGEDSVHLSDIYYRCGICSTNLSLWDDAFSYYNQTLIHKGYSLSIEDLIRQRPETPEIAFLYGNIGILLKSIGRVQDALTCYEMDAVLSQRYNLAGKSLALANFASMLVISGRPVDAKKIADHAIKSGIAEGNIFAVYTSRQVLAEVALMEGVFEEINTQLAILYEIGQLISKRELQVKTLKSLADVGCMNGKFIESLEFIDRALKIADSFDINELHVELWITLGIIHKEKAAMTLLSSGRIDLVESQASLDAYGKAKDLNEKWVKNLKLKSMILTNRGLLYYLMDQYGESYKDLQESLQIRTRLLDEIGQAIILDNLALVDLQVGEFDEAKGFLQESLEIYERFKHKPGLCQVFFDFGVLYGKKFSLSLKMGGESPSRINELYEKTHEYFNESLALAQSLNLVVKIKQAERGLQKLNDIKYAWHL